MDMHTGTKLSVTFSLLASVLAALTAGIFYSKWRRRIHGKALYYEKKSETKKIIFSESDLQWNPNGTDRNHRDIWLIVIFQCEIQYVYKTVASFWHINLHFLPCVFNKKRLTIKATR
jgi:hypothetical protein